MPAQWSTEDAQAFIVRTAYEHFRRTGEWPRVRDFDIQYGDALDPFGGVELLCRQLGHERIGCGSPQSEHDRVTVRLRGLADLPEAKADVESFICAVRLCAKRYREANGQQVYVTPEDIRTECGLDEGGAKRAFALLDFSDVTAGGGPTQRLLSHTASKLADVASIEDYFARVDAHEARRMALTDMNVRRPAKPQQPKPGAVGRLFLSHADLDATIANYLSDALRKGRPDLKVFVASRPGDIPTGDEWLAVIRSELRQADAYLVLLTPVSITRRWVWYESGAAWWSEKRLIPVVAAGLGKADVPLPVGAHQILSLDDPEEVAQLARDIGSRIDDADAFCSGLQAIYRTRPESRDTDNEWKGVEVDGRFFAWDGPLHHLQDRPPVVAPPAVPEALRTAGAEPDFVHRLNVRKVLANGFIQVFETDRNAWTRELLEPGNGDRVLLVRPAGVGPTPAELHLAALKKRAALRNDDLVAYAHMPTKLICVENPGPTDVQDVTLTVLDADKRPIEGDPPFPLALLRAHETFRHPGSFTMGQIPFRARLAWTDGDGKSRDRSLTVELRWDNAQ